ncbi:MAG TPA: alpha/beta hydrolase [Phenylobacterium sp.]
MSSQPLPGLSPEFQAFVANLWASPLPEDLMAMRAAYDGMGAQFTPNPKINRRDATLGGQRCVWFEPKAGSLSGAVLYLHGGGFSIGSVASHAHMGDGLAERTRRATVLVDYRLAPEHPYPAALDDAFTAYVELAQAFPSVALVGDSAGGGLVAALMARAHGEGLRPAVCAYLMSPWVDLSLSSPTIVSKAAVDPFANRAILEAMVARYLPAGGADDPLVSPVLATFGPDTPVLIQTGSAEALLGDSFRLVAALGEADAQVDLQVWRQMIHVWPWLYPTLPEGEAAFAEGSAFVKRHLDRPS